MIGVNTQEVRYRSFPDPRFADSSNPSSLIQIVRSPRRYSPLLYSEQLVTRCFGLDQFSPTWAPQNASFNGLPPVLFGLAKCVYTSGGEASSAVTAVWHDACPNSCGPESRQIKKGQHEAGPV